MEREQHIYDVHRLYKKAVETPNCIFHHQFRIPWSYPKRILLIRTSPMLHFVTAANYFIEHHPLVQTKILTNRLVGDLSEPRIQQILYGEGPLTTDALANLNDQASDLKGAEVVLFTLAHNFNPMSYGQFEELHPQWWHLYRVAMLLGVDRCFVIDSTYRLFRFGDIARQRRVKTKREDLIVPYASMFEEECQLAYDLAFEVEAEGETIECGQYLGGSTICLATGCQHTGRAPIYSVDMIQREIAQENLMDAGVLDHVVSYYLETDEFYRSIWEKDNRLIRLLYYDACKDFAPFYRDLLNFSKHIARGGCIVLQDYNNLASGDIMRATGYFLRDHRDFKIVNEVGCSLVIRRL